MLKGISIGEAFSIKERLFPKYELEYLFEKSIDPA
jgi:hypothetical protein